MKFEMKALIDRNFRPHKLKYVFQCLLAAVAIALILAILNTISNAGVTAALGASTFIVFALPHTQASRARYLIGGYIVGCAVGMLFLWLRLTTTLPQQLWIIPSFPFVIFAASAVGLATFLMVLTNSEHPPAAGLCLGFVMLEEIQWLTPLAVLVGITALCAVKAMLKPILRNLLQSN
jgi:CBS-domain-containing membrane protein